MSPSAFVVLGQVIRAHGLKGELGIRSFADSPLLFSSLQRVYLQLPGKRYPKQHSLLDCRAKAGTLLLRLQGISSREQAKQCLGLNIYVPKKDLPSKEPDQVYLQDLQGLQVFLPTGQMLGSIAWASRERGQEIWSITTSTGKEVLFPAVAEFVQELDLQQGAAIIDPPAGLLEIYLGPSRE
ncbi:MAG: ribosome maturation factor RimM [Desulfohalobiaceae bacterium]